MLKFDYENSVNRKRLLAQESFQKLYWYLTGVNIIILVLIIYLMFTGEFILQGWAQIILAFVVLLQSFYLSKRYAIILHKKSNNLVDNLPRDIIDLLNKVYQVAKKEGVSEITLEYIFAKLPLTLSGRLIFNRLMIPDVNFPKSVTNQNPVLSQNAQQLLTQFLVDKKDNLCVEELAVYLFSSSQTIQEFLRNSKIEKGEFNMVIEWVKDVEAIIHKKKFYEDDTVLAGVGQEWSSGYTPVLSMYSEDLSKYFSSPDLAINTFGHTNIIANIQTVLVKSGKNNILLVGEPGVGKKTIVNALANKLATGDCLKPLKYKRIRQLNTGRLMAGARQGELEARLQTALSDAVRAGNIVLYIDNLETMIGGITDNQNTVGSIDATGILLPFLENSGLQFIASLMPDGYFSKARANTSLVNSFEKIDVNPPSNEDTLGILLSSLSYVEFKYHVFFPIISLKKIIALADRYIHDVPNPEKSLRLLNEAGVTYASDKIKIISEAEIEKLVSQKTNIPIGQADETEKDKLLNLESFLHKRVVGQEEAITAVSDTLRRVRSGLTTGKRPAGVFLFLGPTGVGKTETAKALAENYFGGADTSSAYFTSEKNMIRLDMSEYQEATSINRLIGTVDNPNGILTNAITKNPFSLILLDEIEKADKNVLNIFLQVFEDGRLTDPRGKVSDFTNTIIIATSNAGSELIRQTVEAGNAVNLKDTLVDDLQKQGIFTPEFLNRFDGVIIYKPLTSNELMQIAQLMIDQLNKTLQIKRIRIEVAPEALVKLVELGYDPQFGARPMRRVIQQKVENLLAKKMLEGSAPEGSTVNIGLDDIK